MPDQTESAPGTPLAHGTPQLPRVTVDSYNEELRDAHGFIGDRASKRAFQAIVDEWREKLRKVGHDPLGDAATEAIGKQKLDTLLSDGDPEAAGLVLSAIEEFAQELATVIQRFLQLKSWRDTERIVIGGGLRGSRIGELAIGRAGVLLKGEHGKPIELRPIRHHPDEAGLIGAVQLVPSWLLAGHEAILAVDIGGTNIRVGVIELNLKKSRELAEAHVMGFESWRHGDGDPSREEALDRLGCMLRNMVRRAEKDGCTVAPFVGIGCPGLIAENGAIRRGGQNLPGNWESSRFYLPERVRKMLPEIGGHETMVVLHNDAVVQGLSEVSCMTDVTHWGVLTIGTGLGNARFTNRPPEKH